MVTVVSPEHAKSIDSGASHLQHLCEYIPQAPSSATFLTPTSQNSVEHHAQELYILTGDNLITKNEPFQPVFATTAVNTLSRESGVSAMRFALSLVERRLHGGLYGVVKHRLHFRDGCLKNKPKEGRKSLALQVVETVSEVCAAAEQATFPSPPSSWFAAEEHMRLDHLASTTRRSMGFFFLREEAANAALCLLSPRGETNTMQLLQFCPL